MQYCVYIINILFHAVGHQVFVDELGLPGMARPFSSAVGRVAVDKCEPTDAVAIFDSIHVGEFRAIF